MKATIALTACALIVFCYFELAVARSKPLMQISAKPAQRNVGEYEMCDVCIQAMVIEINELLNIILDGGILGNCADLCGKLPDKLQDELCDVFCDAVGLDVFIGYLKRTDIDPIWMCQLIDFCPIKDCVGDCVDINYFETHPPTAKLGTTFQSMAYFAVEQDLGVGMYRVDLVMPNGYVNTGEELYYGLKAGNYSLDISTEALKSQGFKVGNYTVSLWFCDGECGSVHPHSRTLARSNSTFVVTEEESLW
eukprot:TRINITY_DN3178_c0_g1_i1.p2 TRINITY_DN3178_c0_g1~~TRINITY_DN3178_c0_g1_i1.p2  ORF type:complete len:250 (-),score=45.72 TRINITY_DN3178_c0_g1_i1:147-896(-)